MPEKESPLRAVFLNCTLKPSPEPSNTQALSEVVADGLRERGVSVEFVRIADLDVPPGVKTEMGGGDAWPRVHELLLNSQILVIASPTWVGRPSSLAQRVLGGDCVADLHQDIVHPARTVGAHDVLHLHGLQHQQLGAGAHLVTDCDRNGHYDAGLRCGKHIFGHCRPVRGSRAGRLRRGGALERRCAIRGIGVLAGARVPRGAGPAGKLRGDGNEIGGAGIDETGVDSAGRQRRLGQ